jgi:flagellar M-ring protein FliF
MNENITKFIQSVSAQLEKLSAKQKYLLGAGAAILALSAVVSLILSQQDPYETLFSDLQSEDSRAVTQKLGEDKIPYKSSPSGNEITVPRSMVHQARMTLAKAGIPGQDVVGLEKFDASTLGMSSYVQRIQYVRAVQGELTRTIQRLDSVKRARVHISMPPKKTFIEEEDPPKASVVLELKRGQKPSKAEINGIAHLVASAVEGLKVNQVTIVDTQGSFLHRPEDSANASIPTALLEMQRTIENEYERRVEDILTPVVGLGKVRAKVAVEVDPARVNTTEETFDPDRTVVKQKTQNDETTTGSRPNPVGIPGSRSNLPGAEVQNPAVPTANTKSEKSIQNTAYAVPRRIQVTDKPSGNMKRLTVAVIVDGNYSTVNGAEVFAPRSEQELQRLKELVANAVGLDETRRDSITVSSLPFRETEIAPQEIAEPVAFWKDPRWVGIGIVVLAIVAALIGFLMMLGKKKPNQLNASLAASIRNGPKTIAELEAIQAGAAAASLGGAAGAAGIGAGAAGGVAGALGAGGDAGKAGGQGMGEESESLEKREEAELKRRIIERLDKTPKKGFTIVEEWIEDSNPKRRDRDENSRLLLEAA